MTTIPQNDNLLKAFFDIFTAHRPIVGQQRVYERLELLALAELFTFGCHTVTQLLMSLGLTEQDWSTWYRLFSEKRFNYQTAYAELLAETLTHVAPDKVYVVAGDATQTPRNSRKLEGSGWLRNLCTPPFMVGIHAAHPHHLYLVSTPDHCSVASRLGQGIISGVPELGMFLPPHLLGIAQTFKEPGHTLNG